MSTFVASLVAAERERIESVERRRSAMARRKSEAERKLELLGAEHAKAEKRTAARIADEVAQIEQSTEEALRQVRAEAEDRRRHEESLARRRLKALMADEAVALLEREYRQNGAADVETVLLDHFLQELKARQS